MTFKQKLETAVSNNNSLLCVGLDSDVEKIPNALKGMQNPQFEFNKKIIEATHDLVCAYKPNTAFYEVRGAMGISDLKMTTDYIQKKYPEIIIILDAKRGDIENTNDGYVTFAYDYLGADAITLHPYLGKEALKPFLDRKDKGLFILCRTSNPGAGEFQDLIVSRPKDTSGVARPVRRSLGEGGSDSPDGGGISRALYQIVAEHVTKDWNYNGNCGLVVGATYPAELEIVRRIVGDGFPLLIPGIGAQVGNVQQSVKAGVDKNGFSAIINSSRGIIFASSGEDFAQKAREKSMRLRDEINKFRYKRRVSIYIHPKGVKLL